MLLLACILNQSILKVMVVVYIHEPHVVALLLILSIVYGLTSL